MSAIGALGKFVAPPVKVRSLRPNQPFDRDGKSFCSCPEPDPAITRLSRCPAGKPLFAIGIGPAAS